MTGVTIADIPFANRKPEFFLQGMLMSSKFLQRLRIIDGVKNKINVPIFDAAITFTHDMCTFDPQSVASIGEKEMSNKYYRWDFVNCKDVLQNSYRSVLLKKGQNNPETMDADFKDWLMGHFSQKVGVGLMHIAASEILFDLVSGVDKDKTVTHDLVASLSKANILEKLEEVYLAMPTTILNILQGDSDYKNKPVLLLGTKAYQFYQLAIGDKNTIGYGLAKGEIFPYMNMEVMSMATLPDDTIIATQLDNVALLTDQFMDTKQINFEYEKKINTDTMWGQFRIGFGVFKNDEVVLATKGVATVPVLSDTY